MQILDPDESKALLGGAEPPRKFQFKNRPSKIHPIIHPIDPNDPLSVLSPRQKQIFMEVLSGSRMKDIAGGLGIDKKTISTHKSVVLKKLGLRGDVDIVRFAIKYQIDAIYQGEGGGMTPSQKLVDYIKDVETFVSPARHLPGDRPGVITGGYGFTNVRDGQTFTQYGAENTLLQIVNVSGQRLLAHLKVTLEQSQFDALVDFVYNIGFGDPFSHPPVNGLLTSTLFELVNAGKFEEAADEFTKWVHSDGRVQPGLVKRREIERQWFLEPLQLRTDGTPVDGSVNQA